jgi:hypothetical protein
MYKGYVFRKKAEYLKSINWVCLNNSCQARVRTSLLDKSIKESKRGHCHPMKGLKIKSEFNNKPSSRRSSFNHVKVLQKNSIFTILIMSSFHLAGIQRGIWISNVKYEISENGKDLTLFNGQQFKKELKTKDAVHWVCINNKTIPKCPARVHTDSQKRLLFKALHNH